MKMERGKGHKFVKVDPLGFCPGWLSNHIKHHKSLLITSGFNNKWQSITYIYYTKQIPGMNQCSNLIRQRN